MAILYTLQPNGIYYGLLVHFVVIWYIFTRFGTLDRENLATLVLTKKVVATSWKGSSPGWSMVPKRQSQFLIGGGH
jgi:hypothetical protein